MPGFPTCPRILARSCLVALALLLVAADGDPREANAEDFHPSLKGPIEEVRGLSLAGPNAQECVQPDPAGTRITLPAGHPGERQNTGLSMDLPVKGDFEATVSFEI